MKRHLIPFSLSLLLSLCSALNAADTAKRPNILWLIAEDMGPDAITSYGNQQVWTPNLDKLAAEGVRYTRAYTTAPVCSASRSGFMTGMYQTSIGAHNHRSHRDDGYGLPEGVRPLPEWMRDAGYLTANVVKLPVACGFKGSGKTDWNFARKGKPFESANWDDLKSHQPFYAQINFQETHRTYHAPPKADPAKVQIPPYYPDHPVTRKDWAEYLDAATELDRKIGLVLEQLKADGLADSTVILFFGDHGESHVRGKQFCYEEGLHIPLIVHWPRNFPAPKQFVRTAQNLNPNANLILNPPPSAEQTQTQSKITIKNKIKSESAGLVDDRLIEAIDFAPTMLDIAGVAKPEKMQGRVMFGEHADAPRQYAFGARDRCDETVFRLRTVRDARWRYIRNFTPERPFLSPNAYKEKQYPVWNLLKELHAQGKLTPAQEVLCQPTMPPEELYDLETDPHQIRNLAAAPEHAATLARLRGVLEKWITDTDDQGRHPEPPEARRENPQPKKRKSASVPAGARTDFASQAGKLTTETR